MKKKFFREKVLFLIVIIFVVIFTSCHSSIPCPVYRDTPVDFLRE